LKEEAILLLRRFYVQENEKGKLFSFSSQSWPGLETLQVFRLE
jgi:hypothetical protein